MKTLCLIMALALAGCASSQFNRNYAQQTSPSDVSYGLPEGPHSF